MCHTVILKPLSGMVVRLIMPYEVSLLTFKSVDEILKCTIQMKAIEKYFFVVIFVCEYRICNMKLRNFLIIEFNLI